MFLLYYKYSTDKECVVFSIGRNECFSYGVVKTFRLEIFYYLEMHELNDVVFLVICIHPYL